MTPSFPQWNREQIIAQRPSRAIALNPLKPHGFFHEQERNSAGRIVSSATILLTNKECPWRCLMCDLWKNTLAHTVPAGAIPKQIEYALSQLGGQPEQIKLYNSGSFFDPAAIPPEDYPAIARTVSFSKHVVVESHPRLVGEKALRLRDLLSGSLEVAIGLETVHPQVLAHLNKRFELDHFVRAAEFLRKENIHLRAFVLVKPPFMDEAEGLEWAMKSAEFAFACGAAVVSLIPTRGGNGAMERLMETGEFSPPRLATLERAFEQALRLALSGDGARASARFNVPSGETQEIPQPLSLRVVKRRERRAPAGRVFADTWDLKTFSRCPACLERRRQRIHAMNLAQQILPMIDCPACGGA